MVEQSVLKPVDASTLPDYEAEGKASWIVRELAGSMTGRVMMASYETIKATGKSVVCLSPWGDSSPLLLPCIRFRDLVATSITVETGGTAAILAPAIAPGVDMAPSRLSSLVRLAKKLLTMRSTGSWWTDLWTTSLFGGQYYCPSVVVPVKPGSPLVAWHTSTLSQLGEIGMGGVEGVGRILLECVELCVDWERMVVVASKGRHGTGGEDDKLKREAIKNALTLMVENLMEAGQSQDVKEKVDLDRAGIMFFGLR
ncbi:hypothetical protein M407DRAFT_17397 [Tulasnella calospora MUT 4182]|uniref:Uncharacterized protein n=1 Tax=Tulasnella calospora MUT 4182 TaxID=1051891 RepID=A0A0C3QVT6_9AGAM|nr:hypothetical protein M407DRAFT_17397 [Tulasnella calospora MUT 4182]